MPNHRTRAVLRRAIHTHRGAGPLLRIAFLLLFAFPAAAQWIPHNPVTHFEKQADGVVFTMQTGSLRVLVSTDSIFHITYAPSSTFPSRPDDVVIKTSWPAVKFSVADTPHGILISTGRMQVAVNRADGTLAYADAAGHP